MSEEEYIQDMLTQLTSIMNELKCLLENTKMNKLVRKVLSILPSSWECKVNTILEAK